jgi:hypothetical protein
MWQHELVVRPGCTIQWLLSYLHRNKSLYNKINRRTNFPKFILVRNSTCFGRFLCPSAGVIHCKFGTGTCYTGFKTACVQDQDGTPWSSILILHAGCLQTCITCASAEFTADNSWWWAEELPETCRVSYQNKFGKINASVGFIVKKLLTFLLWLV